MQLASVDLNLLVALDALLEERNVSRAAARLLVGQPAMSSTLARLRALFNDPLLVREGRTLVATPFAESLVEPVRDVLTRIESIINVAADFDPATDHRTFSIIASDYVALVLLRPLMERLPDIAPNVTIQLRLMEPDFLDQVSRGQVDALIMPRELLPEHLPLPTEPLFEDSFVLAAAADNPDVAEGLDAEGFSAAPYLVCNAGVLQSIIERRLDLMGVPRNVEMVAQSFVMAPFLLPGTRLVTVLQAKLAGILLSDDRFRTMPVPVDVGSIHEVMVSAPKRYTDAGHEWLRAQLRELSASI